MARYFDPPSATLQGAPLLMERYFPRRHFASATFVSATLQALLFSRHFDNVPLLHYDRRLS